MSFDLLLTDEAVCLDKAPGDPTAKVVSCTSPEAAYQLVPKGAAISAEDAARHKIKTTKSELGNYTLRLDSHTIARTPEDKAYAATQPQPGLVLARAEQIRQSAALSVASLTAAEAAKANPDEATAKADEAATKKAKGTAENKQSKARTANKGTKATRSADKKAVAAAKKDAAATAKKDAADKKVAEKAAANG